MGAYRQFDALSSAADLKVKRSSAAIDEIEGLAEPHLGTEGGADIGNREAEETDFDNVLYD